MEAVDLGDLTIARTIFRPGWRWSVEMKPVVGGEWCQARHAGVVLQGRFGFSFADRTSLELGRDDVFDIPPGHDGYTVGDTDCVLLEWSGVLAGFAVIVRNRVVRTLLFTDLVGSTEVAVRLGDMDWRELLATHYETARSELERFGGREVKTTGDGILAAFEGTAVALECAAAIVQGALALGLHVRAGVHVGEVQLVGSEVLGVTVHEAARVMKAAGPDEVLASETTRILAAGSSANFVDRGLHRFKGLEGKRRLYAYVPTRGVV